MTTYDSWYRQHKKWLNIFLTLALIGHCGLGMAMAVFGPTQPYLGKKTNVGVDTVNFIWTARSIGVVVMSLLTAFTFRRFCRTAAHKLTFLAFSEIVVGTFMIFTPFANSFATLLIVVTLCGIGLGMFDTADNSLMVYIFGPEKSRPFTQSVHAFVGTGFVLGTLLTSPFLPEEKTSAGDVCPGNQTIEYNQKRSNDTKGEGEQNFEEFFIAGLPSIAWPYIIMAIWHFLTALGFLILAFSGQSMPRFGSTSEQANNDHFTSLKYWRSVLVMVFIYYALSCGLEGFFQSMTYTFGICGPLRMSVDKAAWLTVTYFACFMTGRLSGIFVSRKVTPKKLILGSIITCIFAAAILSIFAGTSQIGLFFGTGLLGFGIAVQFPSGISWTAKRIDVTGNAAFIFFTGGFTGFLSFPPLAGLVFTSSSVGPLGLFYLTLGFTCALLMHFALMNFCARYTNEQKRKQDSKDNNDETIWEEIML